MTTYQSFKEECPNYRDYIQHEFVRRIGDGSLPPEAFRYYLKQDYLFLINFARAWGLAVYKSERPAEMRSAAASLDNVLNSELELHLHYCQQWGIGEGDLAQLPEDPANVAYTRYVLDSGLRGSLAELHVALAPCMLGYAEIGRWLPKQAFTQLEGNPYREWIETYSGEEFQAAARAEEETLDEICADFSVTRRQSAQTIFDTATAMEIAFWQMGLNHLKQNVERHS